ncbi:pilin [Patescibacteria group bacterium]|nr:pilin [Patescibacteria group bacterium]
MKNIKKGVLIILILFNVFFPAISFAGSAEDQVTNSPVTLTTGLPFFPKDCRDIEDSSRKDKLCYKDENIYTGTYSSADGYTGAYKSQGLIKEVFEGIFKFILGSAGTLCVIMLIVSGLQIAFAAGNASILGAARTRMKDSIIGLILTVSSGFILSIINPQLLNFDFKEPTDYTISGFEYLQGKEGAECIMTFQDGDETLEDGKEKVSCDYELYCYIPSSDIEEGDITGRCKKYREVGENCGENFSGELCKEGYECASSGVCQASTEINDLEEKERCTTGYLNCGDNLFCANTTVSQVEEVQGECLSCELLYNQIKENTCNGSGGYCANSFEIINKMACFKDFEEHCTLNEECKSLICIIDTSDATNNKCGECLENGDCEGGEFCNTTGLTPTGIYNMSTQYICEDERVVGEYCENGKYWCGDDCRFINPCASSGDGDGKYKCY